MFSLFDYNYYTDEFLDTYIHEFNESPFSSCQDDTDDLHKIINGENSFKLNFDFEWQIILIINSTPKMIKHLKIQDIKFLEKQISPIIESNFIYIFDSKYEVPKVSISILLKYKDFYKKLLIYSKYFKLKEEMFYMEYDTLLTSFMLEINININEAGIEININGISTKIKYIFNLFIDFLFVNLETKRDTLIIDQIKKNLIKEKFNQSYKRLFQGLKSIVIDDYVMSEDLLDNLNFDEEINIKNCEYKLFILGNLLQEEAKEIKNNLSNKLENNEEIVYSNKLFTQDKILSVKSFDIKNNACGIFFYTNTLDDLYKKSLSSFVVNTFQEMFFDQLRTNEEFGYVVCSSTYSVLNKEFMYFVVQSDRDVKIIKERIFKFIEFAKDYIKNLSEEEFLERKECLIDEYNETYKNINSYSYHLYSKYIYNIDGINYKTNILNFIKQLTLEDIKKNDLFEFMYVIETYRNN